jgi:hypothetical protein
MRAKINNLIASYEKKLGSLTDADSTDYRHTDCGRVQIGMIQNFIADLKKLTK